MKLARNTTQEDA